MKRSDEAAEGVRKVIEAAEALAAEIETEARKKAKQIEAQARANVSAKAKDAEDRLERANRELERIQSVLAEVRTGPAPDPPAPAQAEPAQAEPAQAEPAPDEAAHSKGGESEGKDDGAEGARLIALNMALTGTPREETARYLEENFEVDDPEALLDDVYSRTG